MVAETRHSCENIGTVRGVISPVEYFQTFVTLTKKLLKFSEISESLFKILSFSTSMILPSLQTPLFVK